MPAKVRAPEELEEYIADPANTSKFFDKATGKPTTDFINFIREYKDSVHNRDEALGVQVREQVQATVADMFRNEKSDSLKRLNINYDSKTGAPVNKGKSTGIYNAKAPGAQFDSEFEDTADLLRSVAPHALQMSQDSDALQGKMNRLRKVQNSFGSVVPADGGFLVPETVRSNLLQTSLETAIVRPRATVIPMESLRVPIPMVDSTTNAGSVFGGITCYWTEEGAALVESQASFGRVVLDAKKLIAYCQAPNELVADASAFGAFIDQKLPLAISFFEDVAFMTGSGVGEPLGWVSNPAVATVTAVAGQGANTLVWENIVGMFARMLPASIGSAVWVASIDTFPQLATMALSVGTGGSAVWLNNGVAGPPMTILGRPVVFTEKSPTLGTTGDISFVDLGYYLVGDRQVMQVASSSEYKFGNDLTAYRVIERVDGRPWLQSAITPKNGGPTLSPFVQLSSTRT
jgi:HK97 family phage major capsid protein